MTKNKEELLQCICDINTNATPDVLSGFAEEELSEYLEELMESAKATANS
jgi:hypothetical protein